MAPWDLLYEPFAKYGSDTLLLVAPGKCELRTADAAVISQVTTRRSDFPKPLEVYGSLMLYGTNVVTTEGQIWKAHRKITNPPFSEKNNHLVWAEAIFQAQSMVDSWMRGGTRSRTITNIGDDSMRLALHVISRAGFGRRMQWPTTDEEGKENNSAGPVDLAVKSTEIDEAHTMSYADTLSSLLRYMVWILIVPRPILSMSVEPNIRTITDCSRTATFQAGKDRIPSLRRMGHVSQGNVQGQASRACLQSSARCGSRPPRRLSPRRRLHRRKARLNSPRNRPSIHTPALGKRHPGQRFHLHHRRPRNHLQRNPFLNHLPRTPPHRPTRPPNRPRPPFP